MKNARLGLNLGQTALKIHLLGPDWRHLPSGPGTQLHQGKHYQRQVRRHEGHGVQTTPQEHRPPRELSQGKEKGKENESAMDSTASKSNTALTKQTTRHAPAPYHAAYGCSFEAYGRFARS